MAITFITKYPKSLTNSAWQKNKTFKEKRNQAMKTGLGATLTAAEKAWNAIPFKSLDAKHFKPKTYLEAETNLANAKWAKQVRVAKAIEALKAARKKAEETAKNPALTDKARKAAQDLVLSLRLQTTSLQFLKLDDFKIAVTKFEAAKAGGQALGKVFLHRPGSNTALATGKKAIRKDKAVTVYEISWGETVGDPQTLVGQKLTVKSEFDDGQKYINDMTVSRLSSTKKTAFLNQ